MHIFRCFFSSFIKIQSNITNYLLRETTNTSEPGGNFNMIDSVLSQYRSRYPYTCHSCKSNMVRLCTVTTQGKVSLYVSQLKTDMVRFCTVMTQGKVSVYVSQLKTNMVRFCTVMTQGKVSVYVSQL
jgi:hypothetical protein